MKKWNILFDSVGTIQCQKYIYISVRFWFETQVKYFCAYIFCTSILYNTAGRKKFWKKKFEEKRIHCLISGKVYKIVNGKVF